MAYKIVLANQKGGVGKTTLSMGIAGVLAEQDKRVLLIDMDQQGNLSSVFLNDQIYDLDYTVIDLLSNDAVMPSDVIKKTSLKGIDLLPTNLFSDFDMKFAGNYDSQYFLLDKLNDVSDQYDFMIIDCPPNWGTATRMALVAADGLLVPLECQKWAVKGSSQLRDYVKKVQVRANQNLKMLGFIINKYDSRRGIEVSFYNALRSNYGDLVFKTEFRNHVQYTESAAANLPINFYQPHSDQANKFRDLVSEIKERINYDK